MFARFILEETHWNAWEYRCLECIFFYREQKMKRVHRHRQKTLIFIKVHIWLCCVLFTDSTLNFHCSSGTYQRNATHFLISTDNRGQTFKASAARKPPNYVTEEPIKMQEKPAFSGNVPQPGGKETERHKWRRNMLFSFSSSRGRERGICKKGELLFWFSHQDLSSSWVIELGSIAGKCLIQHAVSVWIQMFHLLINRHMHY